MHKTVVWRDLAHSLLIVLGMLALAAVASDDVGPSPGLHSNARIAMNLTDSVPIPN